MPWAIVLAGVLAGIGWLLVSSSNYPFPSYTCRISVRNDCPEPVIFTSISPRTSHVHHRTLAPGESWRYRAAYVQETNEKFGDWPIILVSTNPSATQHQVKLIKVDAAWRTEFHVGPTADSMTIHPEGTRR